MGAGDILVNNAAFQMTHESVEEIPDDEWDYTIATNLSAFFHGHRAGEEEFGLRCRSASHDIDQSSLRALWDAACPTRRIKAVGRQTSETG